ncbi:hypothetical protein BFJ63_vAg16432 [Fusarium oxysporum f. sp. narcissi]|uniref:Uncharacterized protein n=1 Tax=Fusarium oxysporum f. sp. narcissi TaxID=451672 RepID=A0A4Q2V911_FUSOX|nr:hypothetical protein BFJ63_vAg16432 [Fusarium oxysporum f. sp. narcissi]
MHQTAHTAIIKLLFTFANLFVFIFFLIVSVYISSAAEPTVPAARKYISFKFFVNIMQ